MGVYLKVFAGYDEHGCHENIQDGEKTGWPSEKIRSILRKYAIASSSDDVWYVLSLKNLLLACADCTDEDEDVYMLNFILKSSFGNFDNYTFYRLEWG